MAVTTENIAVLLGRTAPVAGSAEALQWEAWLTQAHNLITWRYGAETVATFAPDVIDYVVTEAVVQHIRSWQPANVQRKSVSVDDGSVDTSWFKSAGTLTIDGSLWAHLDPTASAGVFSLQMTGTPDVPTWPAVWT